MLQLVKAGIIVVATLLLLISLSFCNNRCFSSTLEEGGNLVRKLESKEKFYYHGIETQRYDYDGNVFLGPFFSPSKSKTKGEELIIFPIFEIKKKQSYYCHYDGKDVKGFTEEGVLFCSLPIPQKELEKDHVTITLSVDKVLGTNYAKIDVATWPLREKRKWNVIQTSMVKNIKCDESGNKCIRDWLEWHLMLGVDQFIIYDNGSDKDAKHLEILQHYVDRKQVTLINWPERIGGTDNNMAQRIALNHAIYAFSSRTKWMGFFDVDEFFIPSGYLNSPERSRPPKLTDILSKLNYNPAINVNMKNMMHPDHCLGPDYEKVSQLLPSIQSPESRLALCTHYRLKSWQNEHSKMFKQFDYPMVITTPHQLGEEFMPEDIGHFVHITSKYGCEQPWHCLEEPIFSENTLLLKHLEHRLQVTLHH